MESRENGPTSTAVSRNMDGVGTSATLALLETIQRRRAEGRTVWDLGLGEPVFPAPPASALSAMESVRRGDLRYGPVPGMSRLRECVAAHARRLQPHGTDPLRAAN